MPFQLDYIKCLIARIDRIWVHGNYVSRFFYAGHGVLTNRTGLCLSRIRQVG